jgi:hypothetical protein
VTEETSVSKIPHELNKVTLVWIPRHQGTPDNEAVKRLDTEGATAVPPNQFTAIPFSVGKKLIKKHLELKHLARWATCTGCQQSKMLMRYPLLGRSNKLLAVSRLTLRAAVGLLTGHTNLRRQVYKIGHTERQQYRLCGYDKKDSIHIVCHCPVLACKRYRIWGSMFVRPKDLEKAKLGSLLRLVANTA